MNSGAGTMKREELIRRLVLIKELGWIRSTVPAPKNVGELLEALLGLQTTSYKDPDFGMIEVKSKRRGATNNVSLTTRVPTYINGMSARDFTDKYGYRTDTGKALQCTLHTQKRNSRGWQLVVNNNQLDIDYKGQVLGSISLAEVRDQFENKMNQMVFVVADSEMRGKWEFFRFQEAYLYFDLDVTKIRNLIESDRLVFEFRMRWKNNSFKDYGPAYRIPEDDIHMLYAYKLRVM